MAWAAEWCVGCWEKNGTAHNVIGLSEDGRCPYCGGTRFVQSKDMLSMTEKQRVEHLKLTRW